MLLSKNECLFLIVDFQGRLVPALDAADEALARTQVLLEAARRLRVPVLVTEQYPQGLGPTVESLRSGIGEGEIHEKVHFNAVREPHFKEALSSVDRRQAVVVGAEAHVCVFQTVMGLLSAGWEVALVRDAIASRNPSDKAVAIDDVRAAGGRIVTSEMVVFEWLERAATDDFRSVLPLIK